MRKDTIFGLIRFVEILVATALIAYFINQELRQSCIRVAEIMGYEPYYELRTQCMVKVGGKFIPIDAINMIIFGVPPELIITTIPTEVVPTAEIKRMNMPGTEMPGTDEPPLPTNEPLLPTDDPPFPQKTYTPNGALP